MISLPEFLKKIGAKNMTFQKLNDSVIKAKITKHKDTEITFATNAVSPNDIVLNRSKIGLVVWIDRDVWDKTVDKLNGDKQ